MSATTLPVPSPLRPWLTGGLFALLAFGACWTGAILYWRSRAGDPGTVELLICLFVVPGALLAAGLLTHKRLLATPRTAAITPAQRIQAVPAPADTPESLPLAILATAVRSPHGTSVEEIADGLASKKARPALDAELVDEDGFPLMTARCPDAHDPTLQTDITAWLTANEFAVDFTEEQLRALVLATGTTAELASALPSPEHSADVLQLAPILPADWNAAQRDAGAQWLRHTVAQRGWPSARIAVVKPDASDLSATVPSALLAQLATRVGGTPVTALLIAAASHVGHATAQTWAASQSLFTPGNQHGKVPGEGAIGLLLTDVDQANASKDAPFALLYPVTSAHRPKPANDYRGVPSPTVTELADGVISAAQVQPDAVAAIIADTGPRTSRMLELMGYAGAAMPQLDNEQDVIPFGRASGTCDAVPALTALALAGHYACERNGPVLWLAHDEAVQCSAAVIHPPH